MRMDDLERDYWTGTEVGQLGGLWVSGSNIWRGWLRKDGKASHWTEGGWHRHNQRWMQSSEEGTETTKIESFIDEQKWGKKCFEDLNQRRMWSQQRVHSCVDMSPYPGDVGAMIFRRAGRGSCQHKRTLKRKG